MDWASLSFAAPFRDLFWNLVRCPFEQRDEAEVKRAEEQCARLMAIADDALCSSPYLSGETLGIGDIPLGCIAYAWFSLPIGRPPLKNLNGWYERLCGRPAYRTAVMTRSPDPPTHTVRQLSNRRSRNLPDCCGHPLHPLKGTRMYAALGNRS